MFDLTEPSATEPVRPMKLLSTSAMLSTSTTSPTLVEVPCPSISVAVAGESPAFCQARSMAQLLADRVGRGDALALAVARPADAAQHGVDLVAVALGIGQALQQEDRRAFAHDEAVGALGVGPRAGRRERADLAELDEAGDAHVAVDAAGDRHVEIVLAPALRPPR